MARPPPGDAGGGGGSTSRTAPQRSVSSLRQFNALLYKNWLLKKRKWVTLALELLLPIVFMALMNVLAGSSSSKDAQQQIVEGAAYPVPNLAFLRGQSLSSPAQPNVLCFDNNLFNFCGCKYDKPATATIENSIDSYYAGTFFENPLSALFLSSHSVVAYKAVCDGLGKALGQGGTDEATLCTYVNSFSALCGELPTVQSCPPFTYSTDWSVAQGQDIINTAIRGAEAAGAGVSIPDPTATCSATKLALAPRADVGAAAATLMGAEAAAKGFYDEIVGSVGADAIMTFATEDELENYVKQSGYSQEPGIELLSAAVVFDSAAPDWQYTLRANFTMMYADPDNMDSGYRAERVPPTTTKLDTSFRNAYSTSNYQGRDVYPANQMYYTSGLLSLQQAIDTYILKASGAAAPDLQYRVAFFPSPALTEYTFWSNVGDMFAIVMVLVLMYPVSNVIRSLVVDKELKLKEGMLQMGLGKNVYTLSWLFQFVITFFVLAVLLTLIGKSSVYKFSDGGIVFLYFFLFFLATIALCFLLAAFFSKARSASTYGSLVFFITVFPYFSINENSGSGALVASCLLPSTCFAVGTLPFTEYEGSGQGITSNNFTSRDNVNISMAQVFGMYILDIILYSVLAWYASQVVQSEWGTQRPWYFPFTKSYWRPAAAARDDAAAAAAALQADETQSGRPTIEAVAESLRRQLGDGTCVALRGLTKTFSLPSGEPFKAVDGLDLTMYRGQITALLGHNGAGKTTTMNMLSGMIPVTSGRAYVNGLDVRTQMNNVRQDLGVCPQHDILYPDLTVLEHLRMFAAFKGVPRSRVKEEVDTMIKAVGLVEKRNERTAGLSGGQKRKLSVAIAFIGGSRVVFLDEPTSGMDPHSRRFTWDVIRRQKEGRVIVLTTHFMDEADLLGDRIAIMAQGTLRCCGSSLFLKGLYGVGYNLTIVKHILGTEDEEGKYEDETHKAERLAGASKEIAALVTYHVPKAQILSDVGAEVSFQLPTSASAQFKPLLMAMDQNRERLCVGTYGMSVTTLEEVFIRVAHGTETAEDRRDISLLRQRSMSGSNASFGGEASRRLSGSKLGGIPESAPRASDLEKPEAAQPLAVYRAEEGVSAAAHYRKHVRALVVKRALTYKRDRKMVCFTTAAPALFLLLGLLVLLAITSIDQPNLTLTVDSYNKDISAAPRNPLPYATTCDATGATACDVAPLRAVLPTDYGLTPSAVALDPASTEQMSDWLLANRASVFASGASTYGAYSWNKVDAADLSVDATVSSNYTALHAAPLFNNVLSNGLVQLVTGAPGTTVTVNMHPLPRTQYESDLDSNFYTFPTVLFLMVGLAFIPAAWCGYIVRERETKSKHQQVVSGVSLMAYWSSTLLWDFCSYLLTPPAVLILLAIFNRSQALIGGAEAGLACFLLLLLWGPANMCFTYASSFMFTQSASSMTNTLFIQWVFGLIAPLALFFMLLFPSTKDIARNLKWVLRIHPGFCLGDGLLNLGNRTLLQFALLLDKEPQPFDIAVVGADLIYMVVELFAYGGLTLWLERAFSGTRTIASYLNDSALSRRMRGLKDPGSLWDSDLRGVAPPGAKPKRARRGCCGRGAVADDADEAPAVPKQEDVDVVAERERVQHGVTDVIQIQGLRKAYPASSGIKVAVRNMWLGIPKGQCFALLGINGAGKTTAISTLCGEQRPTEGRATLAGVDVAEDSEAVHRLIGYCPQFDALFETMTAREHLTMYARIKGLREADVPAAVEAKLHEMDLVPYADKLAGGYSGGNKRKLSVAVAMLGGPEIVFLDEPSTGVDPVARRHMWEVISRIVTTNKECALVLTTHSMEEAEALCQRIGIMVGGRLQCLGSAQHLKSRFGEGYQLEVSAALPKTHETAAAAAALARAAGTQDSALVGADQVNAALSGVYPALASEVAAEGRGSLLYQELLTEGRLQALDVAEWALQESTCSTILAFVAANFQGATLLEKQGAKMRLSLPPQPGVTLGTIFGLMEDNRAALGIGEYALGQTSLEQIFNSFASQQAEETDVAPGRGAQELQQLISGDSAKGAAVIALDGKQPEYTAQ